LIIPKPSYDLPFEEAFSSKGRLFAGGYAGNFSYGLDRIFGLYYYYSTVIFPPLSNALIAKSLFFPPLRGGGWYCEAAG
jgi:hypothetical protein